MKKSGGNNEKKYLPGLIYMMWQSMRGYPFATFSRVLDNADYPVSNELKKKGLSCGKGTQLFPELSGKISEKQPHSRHWCGGTHSPESFFQSGDFGSGVSCPSERL